MGLNRQDKNYGNFTGVLQLSSRNRPLPKPTPCWEVGLLGGQDGQAGVGGSLLAWGLMGRGLRFAAWLLHDRGLQRCRIKLCTCNTENLLPSETTAAHSLQCVPQSIEIVLSTSTLLRGQ